MRKIFTTRFITGTVYFLIMLPVFYYSHTLLLNCFIALIAVGCVGEALKISKTDESKLLKPISLLFAAAYPFVVTMLPAVREVTIYLYVFSAIVIYILHFDDMKLQNAVYTVAFTVMPPVFASYALMSRELDNGIWYLILTFVGVWTSDIMAQASGKMFGKHKLGSGVSPNKTVEGCIGSVISATIMFTLCGLFFDFVMGLDVSYFVIAALGAFVSVTSQFGDLIASAVKRNYGVKDFGTIIRGHGGVYDRFDSFILVAPLVYFVSSMSGFLS